MNISVSSADKIHVETSAEVNVTAVTVFLSTLLGVNFFQVVLGSAVCILL